METYSCSDTADFLCNVLALGVLPASINSCASPESLSQISSIRNRKDGCANRKCRQSFCRRTIVCCFVFHFHHHNIKYEVVWLDLVLSWLLFRAGLHSKCKWSVKKWFKSVEDKLWIMWVDYGVWKKKKDHQDPTLKVDEKSQTSWEQKKNVGIIQGGAEGWGCVGKSLNLLHSSLPCLFCVGFGLKLPVDPLVNCLCRSSLTSDHTLWAPVEAFTPIKARSLVMNWGRG